MTNNAGRAMQPGTRAQDSGRVLRWLQENTNSYTRTNFNHYLDSLVLLKLLDFHIRHTYHRKEMNFKFEIDGTAVGEKFKPQELVHPEWRMLLLVAHCHFLHHVRCHTLRVRSRNVSPSRPVHGTDTPVPSTGPIVFVSCFATYLPHLVTEEEHNVQFLSSVITKEALTVRYGNATTQTKLRVGKGLRSFKAKFRQDEAWDTCRRSVASQRHISPST